MSTRPVILPAGLWGCLTASAALFTAVPSPAALNVTPSTISNAFNGTMDLAITGLNVAGQTVIIEKYFDSDDSATITATDQLVLRIKVTDGQLNSVGGQRNLNVPGDEDGSANSAILTRLRTTTAFSADRLAGLSFSASRRMARGSRHSPALLR